MKGSLLDLFGIMIIFFIFALGTMIAFVVLNEYNDVSASLINNSASNEIMAAADASLSYFDMMGVFLLFGLMIAVVIGGIYLDVHPALMGVSILVLAFILLISGSLSNIFYEFTITDELAAAAGEYGTMVILWENMPVIILVIAAILMILIYGFRTNEGNGGGGLA